MSPAQYLPRKANVLLVTLFTLAALSLMAAVALTGILPRLPMAYQNAAWQEARLAAEGGVDSAMGELLRSLSGPNPNTWLGWKEGPNATPVTGNGGLLSGLGNLISGVQALLLGTLFRIGGAPPATNNSVTVSAPIYLDNLKVSAGSGIATEVDVQLWALQSTASPNHIWFRIRSMATCALPPLAYRAPVSLDAPLRRLSLRNVRPSVRKDDVGQPTTVPVPNVSRTVEVLVEPILPFELAIWSAHSLSLCPLGAWNVDSYDSTDTAKSNAGAYPGRGSPLAQANGHIACSRARSSAALYGPLIAANGAHVSGAVATNGGDDPATLTHENVSGTLGLDQTRIRDDFSRAMNPVLRPSGGVVLPPPIFGAYVAGPEDAPTQYLVPGSLTSLRITGPGGQTKALIVVMIEGDLNLAGPLIIPPAVTAVLYVRGNITFHDNVNSGPWNSNRPGQLMIFGDTASPIHQRLEAYGPISICAAFYGPKCDVSLEGGVDWCGSIAAYDFQITSSGDGGVHYDESLATLGPPISFRIARYVEDVRQ
jgi:hypothetical protein